MKISHCLKGKCLSALECENKYLKNATSTWWRHFSELGEHFRENKRRKINRKSRGLENRMRRPKVGHGKWFGEKREIREMWIASMFGWKPRANWEYGLSWLHQIKLQLTELCNFCCCFRQSVCPLAFKNHFPDHLRALKHTASNWCRIIMRACSLK